MPASAIGGPEAAVSRDLSEARIAAGLERQRERRAGAVRLVLDRLEAGVRAGACSDPSRSRGIDNTASPVESAAVDQRRNACPVGERTVAGVRHDGQEPQPRSRLGRLVLQTRPDSVAVTGRCSCFAAGEQQYLLLAGAGTAVLPLRRAKTGALRAPSRSCASRPTQSSPVLLSGGSLRHVEAVVSSGLAFWCGGLLCGAGGRRWDRASVADRGAGAPAGTFTSDPRFRLWRSLSFESMNASVEIMPAMMMEDAQAGLDEASKAF
jgi:hypothetical protein